MIEICEGRNIVESPFGGQMYTKALQLASNSGMKEKEVLLC